MSGHTLNTTKRRVFDNLEGDVLNRKTSLLFKPTFNYDNVNTSLEREDWNQRMRDTYTRPYTVRPTVQWQYGRSIKFQISSISVYDKLTSSFANYEGQSFCNNNNFISKLESSVTFNRKNNNVGKGSFTASKNSNNGNNNNLESSTTTRYDSRGNYLGKQSTATTTVSNRYTPDCYHHCNKTHDFYGKGSTVVVSGADQDGRSVCARIKNVNFSVTCELERTWTQEEMDIVIQYIHKNVCKELESGSITGVLCKRKHLMYWEPDPNDKTHRRRKLYDYMLLYLPTVSSSRTVEKWIEGMDFEVLNLKQFLNKPHSSVKVYEKGLNPVFKFLDNYKIDPSCWLEIEKTYKPRRGFIAHDQIEFECDIKQVRVLDQCDDLAKFLVAAVDIETHSAGEKGEKRGFPDSKKPSNHIFCINTLLYWVGGDANEFVEHACHYYGNISPSTMVERNIRTFSYNSEQAMLEGWRDYVAVVQNVDHIHGYNIFKFDSPYIESRALYQVANCQKHYNYTANHLTTQKEIERQHYMKKRQKNRHQTSERGQFVYNQLNMKQDALDSLNGVDGGATNTHILKDDRERMQSRHFYLSKIIDHCYVMRPSFVEPKKMLYGNIPGRVVFDMLDEVLGHPIFGKKLSSHKLDVVANAVFGEGKVDLSPQKMFQMRDRELEIHTLLEAQGQQRIHDKQQRTLLLREAQQLADEICHYCDIDTVCTARLERELFSIINNIQLSRIIATTQSDIFKYGQQQKILNYITYQAHRNQYVNNHEDESKSQFNNRKNNTTNITNDSWDSAQDDDDDDDGTTRDRIEFYMNSYGKRCMKHLKGRRTKRKKSSDRKGAVVIEPITGMYRNPILTLDYASMYPNIMREYNLCYSTLVNDDAYKNLSNHVRTEARHDNALDQVTDGPTYVKADIEGNGSRVHWYIQHEQGLLPKIESILLEERKKIKAELAAAKKNPNSTKLECIVLDGKQNAVKIVCNAIYGFTGADRLPEPRIMETVTYFGRMIIGITKRIVETYRGLDEAGNILLEYPVDQDLTMEDEICILATVVAGDTDSVMSSAHEAEKLDSIEEKLEFAEEIGIKLANFITQYFNSRYTKLEHEKVFYPFMIKAKKKYSAIKYLDVKQKGSLDVKGIEIVRREQPPFVKRILKQLLNDLMHSNDISIAIEHLMHSIYQVVQDKLPVEDYTVTSSIKDISNYASYELPQIYVNEKMRWRNPGSEEKPGGRVAYVYIQIAESTLQGGTYRKAEDVNHVVDHDTNCREHPKGCSIDREYYINNKLKNAVVSLLKLCIKNPEKLFERPLNMLRGQRVEFQSYKLNLNITNTTTATVHPSTNNKEGEGGDNETLQDDHIYAQDPMLRYYRIQEKRGDMKQFRSGHVRVDVLDPIEEKTMHKKNINILDPKTFKMVSVSESTYRMIKDNKMKNIDTKTSENVLSFDNLSDKHHKPMNPNYEQQQKRIRENSRRIIHKRKKVKSSPVSSRPKKKQNAGGGGGGGTKPSSPPKLQYNNAFQALLANSRNQMSKKKRPNTALSSSVHKKSKPVNDDVDEKQQQNNNNK